MMKTKTRDTKDAEGRFLVGTTWFNGNDEYEDAMDDYEESIKSDWYNREMYGIEW